MSDTKKKNVLGGRYKILDLLGKGGMATVYVALDEKLGRKVAVKVLHEHMEKNEEIRQRFYQEARAISVLDHPNILKIYDFSGTSSKRLWIVSEIIKGYSLSDYVRKFSRNKLNTIVAASIVREICKALNLAHNHGIVHRDIKPENVMITEGGRVKLMDFGIAKDLQNHSMTMTGTFMGSPSYMSPEQVKGANINHYTDIYSIGVLFYEIITGRLPFVGKSTHELTMKIVEGKFIAPRYIISDLNEEIDLIITKCMAKNPRSRPESASILGNQIDLFLASQGFVESHVELERYFKDRAAYQARLDQLSRIKSKRTKFVEPIQENSFRDEPQDTQTRVERSIKPSAPTEVIKTTNALPVAKPNVGVEAPPAQNTLQTAQVNREKTNLIKVRARGFYAPTSVFQAPTAAQQAAYRRASVAKQANRITYDRPRKKNTHKRQNPSSQSLSGILAFAAIVMIMLWGFYEITNRLKKLPPQESQTTQQDYKSKPRPSKQTTTKVEKIDKLENVSSKSESKPLTESTQQTLSPVKIDTGSSTDGPKVYINKNVSKPKQIVRRTEEKNSRPTPTTTKRTVTRRVVKASEVAASGKPVNAEIIEELVSPASMEDVEEVEIESGEEIAAPVKKAIPNNTPASIVVRSNPASEIYLDNKLVGTTVENVSDSGWLKVKAGRVTLTLKRYGYETYSQTLNLKPGQKTKLPAINLSRGFAQNTFEVTVVSNVTPFDISVRNMATRTEQLISASRASHALSLPAGEYLITVRGENQTRKRKIILPGPTNSGHLTFDVNFQNVRRK